MSQADTSEKGPNLTLSWAVAWLFVIVALLAYTSAFREQPRVIFGLLCLTAGWVVASLVHECGHALAASLCRWRLFLFVVRPFGLQIWNRNLAFVPRGYNDGAGGCVGMVPRRPAADTKLTWAIILTAGPVASFILAAFALRASVSASPPPELPPVIVANLWFGLAVQALYQGIFSLLPSGGRPVSDGDQLRALRRTRASDYELGRPAAWTGTLVANKVRLRDLPEWMMAELSVSAGRSDEMARYLAEVEIGRLLDDPPFDIASVRAALDAFRARYGTSDWLASCDAYLAAIWEGDPERAEAALAEVGSPSRVPALTFAAEAALAAWLGDAGTTHARLDAMREALKAESPFRDSTFLDIAAQIEARLARTRATGDTGLSPARP